MYNEFISKKFKFEDYGWYTDIVESLKDKPHSCTTSKLNILPCDFFYPLDWTNSDQQLAWRHPVVYKGEIYDVEKVAILFPDSYVVTYWTHSW